MFWFGGHIFAANSDGRLVLEEAPMNHEYADRRSTRADKHGRLCYKISKCFQGFFQNTFRWQIAHVGKVNKHVRRQGPPKATNPHRVIIAIRTKSETTSDDMISFIREKTILHLHTEVNKVAVVTKSLSSQGTWWISLGSFSFNFWTPIRWPRKSYDIQNG